ncbi:MAG: type II toxin-antitoxin system RelE/ParE family toxin [Sphingosinicella sp.]
MVNVIQAEEFADWLLGLRDIRAAKRIAMAMERLAEGLGNIKRLSPQLSEVKIDYGPGYRLYFTRRGNELIILLCGGDKASQSRDIRKAEQMAAEIE